MIVRGLHLRATRGRAGGSGSVSGSVGISPPFFGKRRHTALALVKHKRARSNSTARRVRRLQFASARAEAGFFDIHGTKNI